MTPLTPEQQDRENLLIDLQKAVLIATDDELARPSMVLWFQIAHWNDGYFDMQQLLDEDCLMRDNTQYQPGETGLDKFAPRAYQLTEKGYKILTQRSQWVLEGILK